MILGYQRLLGDVLWRAERARRTYVWNAGVRAERFREGQLIGCTVYVVTESGSIDFKMLF